MQQENLPRGLRLAESLHAAAYADQLQIVFWQDRSPAREPAAAGRGEGLVKIGKGDAALEVVISRVAVDRGIDLANEVECRRSEARLLDQVAGETNEVRRQLVDRADNFGRVIGIALVMEVAEVNEAAWTRAVVEFGDAQRGRFEGRRIRAQCRRQRQRTEPQKFSTCDPAHAVFLKSIEHSSSAGKWPQLQGAAVSSPIAIPKAAVSNRRSLVCSPNPGTPAAA